MESTNEEISLSIRQRMHKKKSFSRLIDFVDCVSNTQQMKWMVSRIFIWFRFEWIFIRVVFFSFSVSPGSTRQKTIDKKKTHTEEETNQINLILFAINLLYRTQFACLTSPIAEKTVNRNEVRVLALPKWMEMSTETKRQKYEWETTWKSTKATKAKWMRWNSETRIIDVIIKREREKAHREIKKLCVCLSVDMPTRLLNHSRKRISTKLSAFIFEFSSFLFCYPTNSTLCHSISSFRSLLSRDNSHFSSLKMTFKRALQKWVRTNEPNDEKLMCTQTNGRTTSFLTPKQTLEPKQ